MSLRAKEKEMQMRIPEEKPRLRAESIMLFLSMHSAVFGIIYRGEKVRVNFYWTTCNYESENFSKLNCGKLHLSLSYTARDEQELKL